MLMNISSAFLEKEQTEVQLQKTIKKQQKKIGDLEKQLKDYHTLTKLLKKNLKDLKKESA